MKGKKLQKYMQYIHTQIFSWPGTNICDHVYQIPNVLAGKVTQISHHLECNPRLQKPVHTNKKKQTYNSYNSL